MSVRETLNKIPVAAVGVLVLLVLIIIWRTNAGAVRVAEHGPDQLYYSTDDGKTFFPDAAKKALPAERGGENLLLAIVYSCDGGKTRFVGYLQRNNPESKPDPSADVPTVGLSYGAAEPPRSSIQVKKPGDTKWVPFRSREGAQVIAVQCPDGKGEPARVVP